MYGFYFSIQNLPKNISIYKTKSITSHKKPIVKLWYLDVMAEVNCAKPGYQGVKQAGAGMRKRGWNVWRRGGGLIRSPGVSLSYASCIETAHCSMSAICASDGHETASQSSKTRRPINVNTSICSISPFAAAVGTRRMPSTDETERHLSTDSEIVFPS